MARKTSEIASATRSLSDTGACGPLTNDRPQCRSALTSLQFNMCSRIEGIGVPQDRVCQQGNGTRVESILASFATDEMLVSHRIVTCQQRRLRSISDIIQRMAFEALMRRVLVRTC